MMEHVLMDERGETTSQTYSSKRRSVVRNVLFVLMFAMSGAGIMYMVKSFQTTPSSRSLAHPFLSSAQVGFDAKCIIIPDAEDFVSCSTEWFDFTEETLLRCPSRYGDIAVRKVKDGDHHHGGARDMAMLRSHCKGEDLCRFTLSEMRNADDGTALNEETEIIEIDPIEIVEDPNQPEGEPLLMRHHKRHHHPGKVRVYYECNLIESPFEMLDDFMGALDQLVEAGGETESQTGEGETQIEQGKEVKLQKALRKGGAWRMKCGDDLKPLAKDWSVGVACGLNNALTTLDCGDRVGARIFVLDVHPKHHKKGAADTSIDSGAELETPPGKAKGKGRGKGKGKGKGKGHWKGKKLGLELTDVCRDYMGNNPGSICETTLSESLAAFFGPDTTEEAGLPDVTDTSDMKVKYMCSYEPVV